MPRVKLHEQPSYEFQYQITVQTTHLNYANHLGNDSLVGMLQDARVELFRKLGYRELDLGDGKTGIIIGDLVVNFKAEGFLFDALRIECHIGELTAKSFRVFYRLVKEEDNSTMALAETGLIAFDYTAREVTNLPEGFLRTLDEYLKQD